MTFGIRSFGFLSMAGLLAIACGDDAVVKTEAPSTEEKEKAGEITFAAEAQPLADFSYDTGLVPAGSPAQVQLKLAAGGGITVEAKAAPGAKGLEGKAGGGKVSVGLHLKVDGRLKVESMFKSIDEDLPGLKDIDIAIAGEESFDPFLVGDDESARVEASIPKTDLPEIPLGSTPGKLRLSIVEGSVVRSWFRGSCLSVADGKATYDGSLTTEGNIVLHGVLALDLPAPLNKEIDLGDITIPVSAGTSELKLGEKSVSGAADQQLGGKCAGASTAAPAGDTAASELPPKKTTEDDGKMTTDSETGEACKAWTCEDFGGECGVRVNGCGGLINCGTCQTESAPTCTPLTCRAMGATCGVRGDGCGGTVNCGVCPTVCPSDRLEPNNDQRRASLLGETADSSQGSFNQTGVEVSDGDEDWFRVRVRDEGFNGNPTIRATTTNERLEVSAFFECDSLPDYSYCEGNGTPDVTVGRGCRGHGSVALNTDCRGMSETGMAYVRVRKMVSDGTCRSYGLKVSVD